jgi:hypothetical protein
MQNEQDPEFRATGEAGPEDPNALGTDASQATRRPWQRRRYQVAAAIGVTAALGTAVLVTDHLTQRRMVADSGDRSDRVTTPGTMAASDGPTTGATTPAAATSSGPSALAAADRTVPPQPPAPVEPHTTVVPTVKNSGSLPKDHHTLRVVSARGDLTGQRELSWAADSGHPVGNARCTQNFRIGADAAARERPTMLLCWRTSATKSVYTIAVDIDRRPSETASVVTINQTWSKLN